MEPLVYVSTVMALAIIHLGGAVYALTKNDRASAQGLALCAVLAAILIPAFLLAYTLLGAHS